MHRSHAEHLAKFLLADRQVVAWAAGQADDLQPNENLAEQMGHSTERAAAPKRYLPAR